MQVTVDRREAAFFKAGALASLALAAVVIIGRAIFASLSSANPRTEAAQFLADVAGSRGLAAFDIWLIGISGLLTLLVFLALYFALRSYTQTVAGIAVLFGTLAAVFLALSVAPLAASTGYAIPAWERAIDPAARSLVESDFVMLQWVSDGIGSMFGITIAITVFLFSRIALLVGGKLWAGIAWVGMVGAVFGVLAAFSIAAEPLEFAGIIHAISSIIWILGVAVALWRLSAAAPVPAVSKPPTA